MTTKGRTSVDEQLTPEDLDAERITELPDREAMSLISTDPSSSLLGGFQMPDGVDGTTTDTTGTDGGASDAAGSAAATASRLGIDGEASESSSPSMTDADRSEQFTTTDTATAGP
jgi:hypothetical protein